MMKVPYSPPNFGVYLALGILPIEHETDKRQMTFLQHIAISDKDDILK